VVRHSTHFVACVCEYCGEFMPSLEDCRIGYDSWDTCNWRPFLGPSATAVDLYECRKRCKECKEKACLKLLANERRTSMSIHVAK